MKNQIKTKNTNKTCANSSVYSELDLKVQRTCLISMKSSGVCTEQLPKA